MIRTANPGDADKLLAIYAPYVEKTAITFEYKVPSVAEFSSRISAVLRNYPYLLLEMQNRVLGYAYANAFKERAAYDWAVETTIYLHWNARGKGYGRMLYSALEEELRCRGFLNAYACIASAPQPDPFLTYASRDFHTAMGYTLCGTFHQCGYKFCRWYDMIWLGKSLGEHPQKPREILWNSTGYYE